jgi:hypothetical protein
MNQLVSAKLRTLVERRVKGRCEYCLLHQDYAGLPHEADHVIAVKHRGETNQQNLAWACAVCNRFKGSDLASIDPKTGKIVRLFNPRLDMWSTHFRVEKGAINPLTPEGRVTVFLLQFNLPKRVGTRRLLSLTADYPQRAE